MPADARPVLAAVGVNPHFARGWKRVASACLADHGQWGCIERWLCALLAESGCRLSFWLQLRLQRATGAVCYWVDVAGPSDHRRLSGGCGYVPHSKGGCCGERATEQQYDRSQGGEEPKPGMMGRCVGDDRDNTSDGSVRHGDRRRALRTRQTSASGCGRGREESGAVWTEGANHGGSRFLNADPTFAAEATSPVEGYRPSERSNRRDGGAKVLRAGASPRRRG